MGGLLQVWEVEGKVFAQGCIGATHTGHRPQADAETESANEAESRADDEAEAESEDGMVPPPQNTTPPDGGVGTISIGDPGGKSSQLTAKIYSGRKRKRKR